MTRKKIASLPDNKPTIKVERGRSSGKKKPDLFARLREDEHRDHIVDEILHFPTPTEPRPDPEPEPDHSQTRPAPAHIHTLKQVVRDFNKRANSIERDALPAGLLPGASKAIYDALYLRTMGAIVPKREVQATRKELMQWSGIKNIKTINLNIRKLRDSGLLIVTNIAGEQAGSLYEIKLPEELRPDPDQRQTKTQPKPSPAQTKDSPEVNQKMDSDQNQKTVWAGSGNRIENKDDNAAPKTLIKTNKRLNDDERAFAKFEEILNQTFKELTGREIEKKDISNLTQLAELITAELKEAASRTKIVSNASAFLLTHFRRRLGIRSVQVETIPEKNKGAAKPLKREINLTDDEIQECPDCDGRLVIYPEGQGRGAIVCRHPELIKAKSKKS